MPFNEDAIDAHFDVWEWLLQNFGGFKELWERPLVLPTREFFPGDPSEGHAYAARCFEIIKDLMGLTDWPCTLAVYSDTAPRQAGPGASGWSGAAGLYIDSGESVTIAYSSAKLNDPGSLIATLAHELCHYLLQRSARSHPPGGWGAHEIHTDIASCFMGFGIFQCNAAFAFQQWSETAQLHAGWSWERQGYLSESENAYALALFCKLTNRDLDDVRPLLKRNPRDYLDMAMENLREREIDLETLRSIRPISSKPPPILSLRIPEQIRPKREPIFTLEQVHQSLDENPWFGPMLYFFSELVNAQPGEKLHEREFAALGRMAPPLRHAVLMERFDELFHQGGLQSAIVLEEAEGPEECRQMLQMTLEAFEWLDCAAQAKFLRDLIPLIDEHFRLLEQPNDSWDDFLSPLDQDENWHALDKSWDHELRKQLRRNSEQFLHPPKY